MAAEAKKGQPAPKKQRMSDDTSEHLTMGGLVVQLLSLLIFGVIWAVFSGTAGVIAGGALGVVGLVLMFLPAVLNPIKGVLRNLPWVCIMISGPACAGLGWFTTWWPGLIVGVVLFAGGIVLAKVANNK